MDSFSLATLLDTHSSLAQSITIGLLFFERNVCMKLWLIVGVDDLEGLTFAYCTTVEKAKRHLI